MAVKTVTLTKEGDIELNKARSTHINKFPGVRATDTVVVEAALKDYNSRGA